MDGISAYKHFLSLHRSQLLRSSVPDHFWPVLCMKLRDQILDSGLAFQLVKIDYEDCEKTPYDPLWSVMAITDIDKSDFNHIYLIDHAWTFKQNDIRRNLRNMPQLLQRMCTMMQVDAGSVEEQIDEVAKKVWKYSNTYSIARSASSSEDEKVTMWYVLDELGSGITHSDDPNFKAVPFMYLQHDMIYTLLFPIKNVEKGDIVTRNFVEGEHIDKLQREAMLLPWKKFDYDENWHQVEPGLNYFIASHSVETLPVLEILKYRSEPEGKLKVFSQYSFINEFLTSADFEIVDNEQDADILWYTGHFTKYEEFSQLSSNKFINQFPFEYVITIKDLLAIIARRNHKQSDSMNLETLPLWLPTTFNLKTELPKLISYYMQRQNAGQDNHWICKPYNLARGLDMAITNNLDFLCRLPLTGPKVAQKYIENPVLFDRPEVGLVKFDIRYVILLKSVRPTEVYVYNNFFLRFANKPFALDNFEDYEQHFTVMNYRDESALYRLLCEDFKQEWSKQYPQLNWNNIEKCIFDMISELFFAATMKDVPFGIAKSPQSRALYAADIMLSWHGQDGNRTIQPKLLEVNWMPDCQRACQYYPDFYNDIFSVLFLNKEADTCVRVL